jgi:hypothetical protein
MLVEASVGWALPCWKGGRKATGTVALETICVVSCTIVPSESLVGCGKRSGLFETVAEMVETS